MFRSRSFTRFTMRVGLLHLGQSVLLEVSITFLRSAVLAILAMSITLLFRCVAVHSRTESGPLRVSASKRFAAKRGLQADVRDGESAGLMQRKSPQIPHLYGLYKFWAEKSDNSTRRKMPKPLLIFYNSFCPEIWNACAIRAFAACRRRTTGNRTFLQMIQS